MTWLLALLWWLIGFAGGCGFMMWVQSAREYHEKQTKAMRIE